MTGVVGFGVLPVSTQSLSVHRWLLVGALAFYGLARLGMTLFSLQPENIALVWLPSGVGLVMWLLAGRRALPYIVLASAAANFPGMAHPSPLMHGVHLAVASGANGLEAGLAVALMARWLPSGLTRLRDLPRFIGLVVVPATAVNGALLCVNLGLGGYLPWSEIRLLFAQLIFSNSLGMLIVYPLVLAWRQRGDISVGEYGRWLGLSLAILALVWLSFTQLSALVFLVIPVLLLQVFGGHAERAYLTLTLALCMIVALAARDLGPFALDDRFQAHAMLVAYLLTATLLVIGTHLQHGDLQREMLSRKSWQFRANHDSLTGLGNRLLFMPVLDREIRHARRMNRAFSLALVDIDHFKRINDSYGHAAGDRVLAEVARMLAVGLRDTDTVARIGGEEFAILFSETPLTTAVLALERIREKVSQQPIPGTRGDIRVTFSAGITEYHPGAIGTVDDALQAADRLLYEAKRQGRNRVGVIKADAPPDTRQPA